jgi:hypothetical protein
LLLAVRITYAPLLLGALLWYGFRLERPRVVRLLAGMVIGFVFVSGRALGAFLHPSAAYTDIVQVQLERVRATPYLFRFNPGQNRRHVLSELVAHFWPAVLVLLLAARHAKRALSSFARAALTVVGAALCLHFLPTPTYLIYSAALALPLFAAAGAHVAHGTLSMRLVSLVSVAGLASQSAVLVRPGGTWLHWLPVAAHALARGESGRAQAAHALARLTPPHSEVWTFDTSVAVEAERRVPPGFEMSFFGFYAGPLAPAAPRRGLLDLESALEPLRTGRVAAVVASRERSWNVLANAPREREALWHAICEHYEPRLHFADEYYSELWLLLPRSPPAPTPQCERLFASADGRP